MAKPILPIVFCAILASFGAQAKDKGPTATVVLNKGYDKGAGLGTGTAQFYDYAPDNRCSGRKRLYKFSLITGPQANKPIPAGQKLVLSAYTNRYNSEIGTDTGAPGVSVRTATCENRLEFTPVAGETYIVTQHVEVGKRCTMSIVANSRQAAPPDLKEIDAATCTKKS